MNAFATQRVLVVDDNPKIHDDFRKILTPARDSGGRLAAAEASLFGAPLGDGKRARFELVTAHSGEAALELVREAKANDRPFAVAFVDIRMPPGWDGVRTVSELWAIDPRVQVALCTAYSDYAWEDVVARLGESDDFLILMKPFDTIEVRQIAHALGNKWLLARQNAEHLDHLEREVARRTAELARTNERLQAEMSNRLTAEKDLRHVQKLEALGRLVASVGHEINNPLTYVISNLEICKDGIKEATDRVLLKAAAADLIDAADDALTGADRIRRIVQDIRIFATKSEAPLAAVDTVDSLEAAVRLVGNAIRHRATIVRNFDAIPQVRADRHRLEQVFVNLLMNSTQAFPEGSTVENEIRMSAKQVGDEIVVEIADNGHGIAPADLERIFEPFFTTREPGRGTGLGLSICRGIVDSFDGRLEVESTQGRGTTARVHLRLADEQAKSTRPLIRPGIAPNRKRKVLVIDDEPAILRAVKHLLSPCETKLAATGREALEVYDREDFDVVLCDVMMPELSGLDVLNELAKRGPEHAARVIFMTGGVFIPEVAQALAAAGNVCLDKPLSRAKLLQAIEDNVKSRAEDDSVTSVA